MKVRLQKQIGKLTMQIESSDTTSPKDAIWELAKNFSFPGVSKCGLCSNEYLDIQGRLGVGHGKNEGKKFKYIFVKCLKCGAELNINDRTEDGVLYFKKTEQGKWDWKPMIKKGE